MKPNDPTPTETPAPRTDVGISLGNIVFRSLKNELAAALAELKHARAELKAYRQGGVTEEILRRHDGAIKVGVGISFVLTADRDAALDALERMAREHCSTTKTVAAYNGNLAGSLATSSDAIAASACALKVLARAARFRIITEYGRMVVGYWPDNDSSLLPEQEPKPEQAAQNRVAP